MTLADLVIVVVTGLAAATGWRRGLTGFAFGLAGLVVGSIVGALLVQRVVGDEGPAVARLLLQVGLVLGPAVALAALGRRWGTRIGRRLDVVRLRTPDRVAGAAVRGGLALVLLSLAAAPVLAVAPVAAQRPVVDSVILHATDALLPAPQRLAAAIVHTLRVPSDLAALVPSEGGSGPSRSEVARVRDGASASLVSIHGSGVDGTGREGSGFVVRPGVVATNAHVVADTTDLSVTDAGGRHPATVVVIDNASDVALLRVTGSSARAIMLAPDPVTNGTPAVVMGFPGTVRSPPAARWWCNDSRCWGPSGRAASGSPRRPTACERSCDPATAAAPCSISTDR